MCDDALFHPGHLVRQMRAMPANEFPQKISLEPVDSLTITTLVDNSSDALLVDKGPAKRTGLGAVPRIPARLMEPAQVGDALQAEHGFAALVEVTKGGKSHKVLFDAGLTPDGMRHNMERLGIDPKDIDVVILSHGHMDHTAGLGGFVDAVGGTVNMPVVLHPEAWTTRRLNVPGRQPLNMPHPSKSALEGVGFEVIENPRPSCLLDGALLMTGEVDRVTEFETGMPGHERFRNGEWEPDPLIIDDQALIANVAGKGLVVLTGCGHAGIVNIARYAQRLTGESKIYSLMGGYHLTGYGMQGIIEPTVEAMKELEPEVLVPAHCTGWQAQHALAVAMPDAFIPNSVGTRYELAVS